MGRGTTYVDPRAQRTRDQLQRALLDLARERDLDEISISAVTAAAGVNRATFYLHYPDKDALLLDAMMIATTAVMTHTAEGAAAAAPDELDDPTHAPAHTRALFRELDDHAPLYRRVLGPNGSPVVAAHLRVRLQDAIATELERRARDQMASRCPPDVSVDLLAGFLAGGILAAATIWLDEPRRRPPDDIARAVWAMVWAAVAALPADQPATEATTEATTEAASEPASEPATTTPTRGTTR